MPPVAKPNRRTRRTAKFKLPKEQRVAALDNHLAQFKATLFDHEANIERLADRLDALPPAPADGDDPHADERESLEANIAAQEKAMDDIEAAIETTTAKRDALKAA